MILVDSCGWLEKERNEESALLAIALMQCSRSIPLKENIALLSADISIKYSLPMADAIVYATALSENSLLISSDEHFKNLEQVEFIPKLTSTP